MGKRAPSRRKTKRALIETRGLTKRFGPVVAVHDLDLEVREGEVFGYLGPNGAGKSTTIRMLLDFIRPTEGSFSVLGLDGGGVEARRRIGYLPAEIKFDQRYSAAELVRFYGDLRGVTDYSFFDELVERFSIETHRPLGHLSTGNRRKVAIAQAFFHRPELLILDEPTAGLDPLLQNAFHDLVRQMRADGTTFFLSSHFLPEVEALADRVGILRRGELVEVASITTLLSRARQRIDLHVQGAVDIKVFERIKNVREVWKSRNVVSIVVDGDVDAVIKAAAKLKVKRVSTHATDLEDVFLELYAGDDHE